MADPNLSDLLGALGIQAPSLMLKDMTLDSQRQAVIFLSPLKVMKLMVDAIFLKLLLKVFQRY